MGHTKSVSNTHIQRIKSILQIRSFINYSLGGKVVSNEEIKRMLDAKRKGINIKDEKNKSENYTECSQCKTKNPEKAVFCVNCGSKLEKNLIIKCPSCGTENTVVAKFCVGCGEKLNQNPIDKIWQNQAKYSTSREFNWRRCRIS